MKKIIVAYVPVLHDGYRKFFERHADAKKLFILGSDVTAEYRPLTKDIRALPTELITASIRTWGIFDTVEVLDKKLLVELAGNEEIIMPDDEVCRDLAVKYFAGEKVSYDNIFLRWDKHKAMEAKPVETDQKISREKFDLETISLIKAEAEKSSDWWRHVGAAIIKDGKILVYAHNEHLPSEHSPYVNGDPRDNFHKGEGMEYSTAIHAEAKLIAEAARRGVPLEGASLYVSVFPCPTCAKSLAFSGIKKLFYAGGYCVLDQDKILKSKGVEIIYVAE